MLHTVCCTVVLAGVVMAKVKKFKCTTRKCNVPDGDSRMTGIRECRVRAWLVPTKFYNATTRALINTKILQSKLCELLYSTSCRLL